MAEEKAWAEYWEAGEGGEAVGGAHRHKLVAQWAAFFAPPASPTSRTSLIVDIAAGAGVALAAAIEAKGGEGFFLAVDFASTAVKSALRAHTAMIGAAADAARLPLRDACADFVISQFGVEYAGAGAFAEAARVLAPGGRYRSLSHYAGGAIDLECAENERLLGVLEQTRIFAAARQTLEASYRGRSRRNPAAIDQPLDAKFAAALARAASAVRVAPASAARATLERLLADLSRLSARRLAYEPADAFNWLGGMEASLGAYLKRMQSMRASALGRADIDAIGGTFAAAGLTGFRAEPLILDENRSPAAWVIDASRPPAS